MVKDLSRDIPELMTRAERSLEAARLLIDNEYYPEAVSRTYYAMFYAATALLHSEGIAVSKHSAVIAQVGQHFANTGKIAVHLHRALIDVFDERQTADYGGIIFSHDDTESAYQAAGEFVQAAREYLDELG
ncbi:MAG: HEPN domain-containing protein [Chloroflexi bacterium]|nr:HEPN domain-containing protein [Chloroflexota bacterium]